MHEEHLKPNAIPDTIVEFSENTPLPGLEPTLYTTFRSQVRHYLSTKRRRSNKVVTKITCLYVTEANHLNMNTDKEILKLN